MTEKIFEKYKNHRKIVLSIKVKIGAGKTEIVEEMDDGVLKMDVRAVPEKGKANEEIIKYLAKAFKTGKENVKIITGRKSSKKLVKIFR